MAELLVARLTDRLPAGSRRGVRPGGRRRSAQRHRARPGRPAGTHPDAQRPSGHRPRLRHAGRLRAVQRDGRLHGRGAVDMKAALAAMIICLETLAAPDVSFAGQLVLTAVAGEESGSAGMLALSRSVGRCRLRDRRGADVDADRPRPQGRHVDRGVRSAVWRRTGASRTRASTPPITPHGSSPPSSASSCPGWPADASAARQRDGVRRVVTGGDRPPMVPAACSVQLDRRWLPGERHADVLDEIRTTVAELQRSDPDVRGRGRGDGRHVRLRARPARVSRRRAVPCSCSQRSWAGTSPAVPTRSGSTSGPTAPCWLPRPAPPPWCAGRATSPRRTPSRSGCRSSQVRTATEVYVEFAARFLRAELGGSIRHG